MLKAWKKKLTPFRGHKNNVVYWIWFLCCTQGKWLSFSPCTLICKPFSLAEAVASGTLLGKHNSFDFSGALPNLAFLRAEMWLHWLPPISLEPQAGLLSWLPRITSIITSQLLIFRYLLLGPTSMICTHLFNKKYEVDSLALQIYAFPL